MTPEGDSELGPRIRILADLHEARYNRLDELKDLDEAINHYTKNITLSSQSHTELFDWLDSLALLFHDRFKRLGELADLDKAISHQSRSISLAPQDHSSMSALLDQLGGLFDSRFQRLGELPDLDKAIEYKRQAVALTPEEHPKLAMWLNSLACSLDYRFERLGKLADLDQGIQCMRKSISLTPEEDESMPTQLSNLGSSFASRFERLGELEDLDKALEHRTWAAAMTPEGHPSMSKLLSNLGSSHEARHKRLGGSADLDEAIYFKSQSVSLAPQSDSDMAIGLNNLALSLESRFQHRGDIADLDKAIEHMNNAISLTPQDDSDKPVWLNNLSFLLNSRFKRLGNSADLDKGIEYDIQALSLTPRDHARRPLCLGNLGSSFKDRFRHRGQPEDLNQAIVCASQAVALTPHDHPDTPRWLHDLGSAYESRSNLRGVVQDAHLALHFLQKAAESPGGDPNDKFKPALQWARLSDKHCAPSLLKAYQRSMSLLPQVVWLGNPVGSRYSHILGEGRITYEAAAAAIKIGDYGQALEWLEEGRSMVWKQMLYLRTHLEDVAGVSPDLALEFQQVSKELDHLTSLRSIKDDELPGNYCPEHADQRRRRLAVSWEALADKVRDLPGFEAFLRPLKATELMRAATSGPVVVINVHDTRCDALIIRPNISDISHVPLELSHESLTRFRAQMLHFANGRGLNQRGFQVAKHQPDSVFVQMLAALWKEVVRPILDFLGYMVRSVSWHFTISLTMFQAQKPTSIDQLPHVTWCITGPLAYLPIHAAGDYESQTMVFDYVVSSYTPNLSALLSPPAAPSTFSGILAVGQSSTPDMAPLPGTIAELTRIQDKSHGLNVTRVDEELATPAGVLAGMEEHSWVHMACHAIQRSINPMKSAFYLHGGMLTLAEITQKQLKHADFAFLSACQTATGDENLPDEAVHLAAGMLMVGYRTVIATMWSICDDDAPLVAETVYDCLLEGGKPDARRAAVALHRAMERLRAKVGLKAFAKWMPYIHIGQ